MIQINPECLFRQKMHRNRVAAERIQHQHLKMLRLFFLQLSFQRKPRITQLDLIILRRGPCNLPDK